MLGSALEPRRHPGLGGGEVGVVAVGARPGCSPHGAVVDDPVAALVFGAQPPLELLLVGGEPVVRRDELQTADADALARGLRRAHRQLMKRVRV